MQNISTSFQGSNAESLGVSHVQSPINSSEKNLVFNGKYATCAKIESTSSFDLHLGLALDTGEQVAIKTEKTNVYTPLIPNEARILQSLQPQQETEKAKGIPQFHWKGTEKEMNVLVSELLGPSLGTLLKTCDKPFSLKTTLVLAIQMLRTLEYVHSKGYVHRDVNPKNFATGLLKNSSNAYLINYGNARHYKNIKTGAHKPYAEDRDMVGVCAFRSINCHLGVELSRRDDLESLGYTLIYFCKGSLPWQGLQKNSRREKLEKVMEKKMTIPAETLCNGLPDAFAIYLNYCKRLEYDENPDYHYLRALFKTTLFEKGLALDNYFDWVTQKMNTDSYSKYDFGNFTISFKGSSTQTGDVSMSMASQLLSKSNAKLTNRLVVESDMLSQQEEEASSAVPIDLSITQAYYQKHFPSKSEIMPPSVSFSKSITLPSNLKNSYQADDTAKNNQQEKLKEDEIKGKIETSMQRSKSLRTSFKPFEEECIKEDKKIQEKKSKFAGTSIKTISLKIPDRSETNDRTTVYNVVLTESKDANGLSPNDQNNNLKVTKNGFQRLTSFNQGDYRGQENVTIRQDDIQTRCSIF